ncbi:MAG: helix-turn-helix transcriptional regulator [Bacteroidales bacterium]|nr:helix-turn-helix transcriptional regulator [Bacteroidales bacterium]
MKDRIYQLMKQQGLTQQEFANELCIAPATLSGIFNGRTKPTNNIVAAIHERFPELSIPWLMFGEGDMYVGERVVETPLLPSDSSASSPSQQSTALDLFSSSQNPVQNQSQQTLPVQPIVRETIKYLDKPQRKITEIRVFFDDGTYETFSA